MPERRALLRLAGAGALGLARPAIAQDRGAWPNRSIRLVLGFAPGGVGDLTARLLAPKLGEALGQSVVIDNRPSAGGIVAAEAVAHSAPDGYTLLLLTNTNTTASWLYRTLPYDVLRDFTPVGRLAVFDHVILASAASPWHTLAEALAAARAHPGTVNIGSISVGNAQHLGAELLRSMSGTDLTVVPYRSTPDLVNALLSGDVQLGSEILAPVLPQIEGGRLRALAMASAGRFPTLPDVPTATEHDLPGYVFGSWNGVAAPRGTPAPIVERLNAELVRAMALPEIRDRLLPLGVQPATGTPAEFGAFVASESERFRRIIEDAHIPTQ